MTGPECPHSDSEQGRFGCVTKDANSIYGYAAPEVISGDAIASKEADIHDFGIVVYEVITGTHPFGRHALGKLMELAPQGPRPPRLGDPVAVGFGQGTWEFIERCWDEDPRQRPSAREALEHFEHVAKTSAGIDPGPTIALC